MALNCVGPQLLAGLQIPECPSVSQGMTRTEKQVSPVFELNGGQMVVVYAGLYHSRDRNDLEGAVVDAVDHGARSESSDRTFARRGLDRGVRRRADGGHSARSAGVSTGRVDEAPAPRMHLAGDVQATSAGDAHRPVGMSAGRHARRNLRHENLTLQRAHLSRSPQKTDVSTEQIGRPDTTRRVARPVLRLLTA
jgi:hypothetical protein